MTDVRVRGLYGKQLPHSEKTHPRLKLATAVTPEAMAQVPEKCDWTVGIDEWPMFLNDLVGDCFWAGVGHQIETYTYAGTGTAVVLGNADIEKGYESTGYRPGDPSTDQGTNCQDGYGYMRSTGMAGHKIAGYLSVDPTNASEVKLAIYYFGPTGVGFMVPRYAETQFDAGQPWDIDPNGDTTELGGHYVPAVAYDATGYTVVTWAALQRMTQAFLDRWAGAHEQGEMWIAVDQEMLNAQGMNPFGLNFDALRAEWAQINPSQPFPLNPAPVTPPGPDPNPNPDAGSDANMALVVRRLLRHPIIHELSKPMRATLRAWLADRNLLIAEDDMIIDAANAADGEGA